MNVILFWDFNNAFNPTEYDILLKILRSFNIVSLDWFCFYLFSRLQRTCLKVEYSVWKSLLIGLPQGGLLISFLFSFFLNNDSAVNFFKFHLYDDDFQLYQHCSVADVSSAVNEINWNLHKIHSGVRVQSFGLVVNCWEPLYTLYAYTNNFTQHPNFVFSADSFWKFYTRSTCFMFNVVSLCSELTLRRYLIRD